MMRRKLRKDWTCVQTFEILKPLAEVQADSARFLSKTFLHFSLKAASEFDILNSRSGF